MRYFTLLMLCLTVRNAAMAQVSPLLTTTWNQDCNYNANCPATASGGACGKTYTGCGATSMAQVMKFWQHPVSGWGNNSYTPSGYPVQNANFAATTYNWAAMPAGLSGANASVAELMHHCGVSVNMQYSGTSSNSSFTDLRDALKENFRYSLTVRNEMKWAHSDSAWAEIIKTELDAGRPVLFSGSSHFWVVDGYQYTPALEFHMNWGWGGLYNGYYALNDLTPGTLSFPNSSVIIGIQPAQAFEISPDTMEVSYFGSTLNQYEVSTVSPFTSVTGDSWITLDSAGGTAGYHRDKFTVPANNSYFERWGYIVCTSGAFTDTIVVHQPGHPSALDISADTLVFAHTGGAQGVDIYCNTGWNISGSAAWVNTSVASGSGLANVNVTASANTGLQRIHNYSITNGTFTRSLVVVQEASPTAAIYENENIPCTVFPNPTTGMVQLHCAEHSTGEMIIFNTIGKPVLATRVSATLDVSALPAGMYIVKLMHNNGNSFTVRVVKE